MIWNDYPDRDLLALALKGASEAVETAFFSNLTQRAGDVLRDEIAALGPVKRADVEAARSDVIDLARSLIQRGDISVASDKLDELVE